jgi:hypothetical protein
MTVKHNTLVSLEALKRDCESHHQLTLALLTLIETRASPEAIKLVAEEVHERADTISSFITYCDLPGIQTVTSPGL